MIFIPGPERGNKGLKHNGWWEEVTKMIRGRTRELILQSPNVCVPGSFSRPEDRAINRQDVRQFSGSWE